MAKGERNCEGQQRAKSIESDQLRERGISNHRLIREALPSIIELEEIPDMCRADNATLQPLVGSQKIHRADTLPEKESESNLSELQFLREALELITEHETPAEDHLGSGDVSTNEKSFKSLLGEITDIEVSRVHNDEQFSNVTDADIHNMRIRYQCAAYHGAEAIFCQCCHEKTWTQGELRLEAIQVAVSVYHEASGAVVKDSSSISAVTLQKAGSFLTAHKISLQDVEHELLSQVDAARNLQPQPQDRPIAARKKSFSSSGADGQITSRYNLRPKSAKDKAPPMCRLQTMCDRVEFQRKVADFSDDIFNKSIEALQTINTFYHINLSLKDAQRKRAPSVKGESVASILTDFHNRCLEVYIQHIIQEQHRRMNLRFTISDLSKNKMHGTGHDRIALALGQLSPLALVRKVLVEKSELALDQQTAQIRSALLALFDHTSMQFMNRLHIIPEDRVELLDRLNSRLKVLGCVVDLQEHGKVQRNFREVFDTMFRE